MSAAAQIACIPRLNCSILVITTRIEQFGCIFLDRFFCLLFVRHISNRKYFDYHKGKQAELSPPMSSLHLAYSVVESARHVLHCDDYGPTTAHHVRAVGGWVGE